MLLVVAAFAAVAASFAAAVVVVAASAAAVAASAAAVAASASAASFVASLLQRSAFSAKYSIKAPISFFPASATGEDGRELSSSLHWVLRCSA